MRVKLQERIKELECLYEISALIAKPDVILISQLIQGVTDTIPLTFRKPEHTCARISIDSNMPAQTVNYESSPWKLSADIDQTER